MRAQFLAVVGVLVMACGESYELCDGACPDLSGTYGVRTVIPAGGACEFEPYQLAPSLELRQAAPGGAIALTVIDPVSQLFVPISGDVSVPENPDPDVVAAFVLNGQVLRPGAPRGETRWLDLNVSGFLSLADGRRRLSGNLQTTDLTSTCFTLTRFTAFPGPPP